MYRAYFPKEKHQNSRKNGRNSGTFVLALSLVWFAGATPDTSGAISEEAHTHDGCNEGCLGDASLVLSSLAHNQSLEGSNSA